MLTPITCHESQPHKSERNQEHKYGRASVHTCEEKVQESIVAQLASTSLECEGRFPSSQEISGQIKPDQEVESSDISQEVPYIISLIANCGRKIIWAVALDVMVLDVMKVVRIPCMAHQRIEDIWEQLVDESIPLAQDSSHMNVLVL